MKLIRPLFTMAHSPAHLCHCCVPSSYGYGGDGPMGGGMGGGKGGGKGDPGKGGGGGPGNGDWICIKCGNLNFSTRTVCNMRICGAPKPTPQQMSQQQPAGLIILEVVCLPCDAACTACHVMLCVVHASNSPTAPQTCYSLSSALVSYIWCFSWHYLLQRGGPSGMQHREKATGYAQDSNPNPTCPGQ
jgi:hypothetical protein